MTVLSPQIRSGKWLALAALHGIKMNAGKISLQKSEGGQVKVVAVYRPDELPSTGGGDR